MAEIVIGMAITIASAILIGLSVMAFTKASLYRLLSKLLLFLIWILFVMFLVGWGVYLSYSSGNLRWLGIVSGAVVVISLYLYVLRIAHRGWELWCERQEIQQIAREERQRRRLADEQAKLEAKEQLGLPDKKEADVV